MLAVLFMFSMKCGCTEGIVDDGFRLVVCSADACRGHWWCECADEADPQVCDHAVALLARMAELSAGDHPGWS